MTRMSFFYPDDLTIFLAIATLPARKPNASKQMADAVKQGIVKTVALLSPSAIALAVAMDIYIPAVPKLVKILHTDAFHLQLTLNLFMVFSGLAQLLIGPLSDQFGRRSLLLTSSAIFTLASGACALATHINTLILLRVVQAIGACGMLVVANAVVRDSFSGVKSAKVYSYLNGAIAFSPLFAPLAGSFIDLHFGWRYTFLLPAMLGLLNYLLVALFIRETMLPGNRQAISMAIFKRYLSILMHRQFIAYALSASFGLAYLFTFFAISPFILMKMLHVSEQHFGWFFAFMGVSFLLGSLISSQVVGKIGVCHTVMMGNAIALVGGLVMLAWYYGIGFSINSFVWPMLPIGIGGTIAMGAGASGAMQPFKLFPGAASATLGCTEFFLAAIIGGFIASYQQHAQIVFALAAIGLSLLLLVLFPLLNIAKNDAD